MSSNECGEFADARRAGVAEEDEGGVAGVTKGGPVDAGHERADLGDREWVGLPNGRDAVGAPEPIADLADGAVLDGVGQACSGLPKRAQSEPDGPFAGLVLTSPDHITAGRSRFSQEAQRTPDGKSSGRHRRS